MIIYIDESGDPGFKISKGSSRYFVLSGIIFRNENTVLRAVKDILEYKKSLKVSNYYELKFNKLNREERVGFLKKIEKNEFSIVALKIDKSIAPSVEELAIKELDYNYFLAKLLGAIAIKDKTFDVRVDGSMNKAHKNMLKSYLRKCLPSQSTLKLQILDSKDNTLIQMVDVVTGCIRKSLTSDMDKNVYREIIKKHIKKEIYI
jgi:hypothetical protein